jgi:hypothetical protein
MTDILFNGTVIVKDQETAEKFMYLFNSLVEHADAQFIGKMQYRKYDDAEVIDDEPKTE